MARGAPHTIEETNAAMQSKKAIAFREPRGGEAGEQESGQHVNFTLHKKRLYMHSMSERMQNRSDSLLHDHVHEA